MILLPYVLVYFSCFGHEARGQASLYTHIEEFVKHRNWHLLPNDVCGTIDKEKPEPDDERRIHDGHPFYYTKNSGFAALYAFAKSRATCGGSVITEKHVLTAAHCCETLTHESFVQVGVLYNYFSEDQCKLPGVVEKDWSTCNKIPRNYHIDSTILHEGYYPDTERTKFRKNDICLVRVKAKITFDEFVKPICLPTYLALKFHEFKEHTLQGLGDYENYLHLDSIHYATLPVVPLQECIAQFKNYSLEYSLTDSEICAGGKGSSLFEDSYSKACNGDDGGPLINEAIINQTLRYFLIGSVTFGSLPIPLRDVRNDPPFLSTWCDEKVPTVFTKTEYYIPWILENLEPNKIVPISHFNVENLWSKREAEFVEDYTKHQLWYTLPHTHCGVRFDDESRERLKLRELIPGRRVLGRPVEYKHEYPWLAAIYLDLSQLNTGEPACGGSVINERFILSSASCCKRANDKFPNYPYAQVGGHDLIWLNSDCKMPAFSGDNVEACEELPHNYRLAKGIVHEGWKDAITHDDDIGLFVTMSKIIFLEGYVKPICLPTYKSLTFCSFKQKELTVSSWGWLDGEVRISRQQSVPIPVVPLSQCQASLSEINQTIPIQKGICAHTFEGSLTYLRATKTCNRVQGYPAVREIYLDGRYKYFAFGVVSTSNLEISPTGNEEFCSFSAPSLFTNVAKYIPWILDNMSVLDENNTMTLKEETDPKYDSSVGFDPAGNKKYTLLPKPITVSDNEKPVPHRDVYDNHPNWHLLPTRICGLETTKAKNRVYGGEDDDEDHFVVRLYLTAEDLKNKKASCGGFIVNENHIVTAAHCCNVTKPDGFVQVSSTTRDATNEACKLPAEKDTQFLNCHHGKPQNYRIDSTMIHPGYDIHESNEIGKPLNDICVVRLRGKIPFDEHVKPICLPTYWMFSNGNYRMEHGEEYTTTGWGMVGIDEDLRFRLIQSRHGGNDTNARVLQKAKIKVVRTEICQAKMKKIMEWDYHPSGKEFCAGGEQPVTKKIRKPCPGDSGSPLFKSFLIDSLERKIVFGIVAYGEEIKTIDLRAVGFGVYYTCGYEDVPAMYVAVEPYIKWILDCLTPATASLHPQDISPFRAFETVVSDYEENPKFKNIPWSYCGTTPETASRIVGHDAYPNEFPWLAAIFESDVTLAAGKLYCSGAIINERYILTSGNCAKGIAEVMSFHQSIENTDCYVHVGGHSMEDTNAGCRLPGFRPRDLENCTRLPVNYRIHSAFPLQYYDPDTLANDIGLIRTKSKIIFIHEKVKPVCLPIYSSLAYCTFEEKFVEVAGWGKRDEKSQWTTLHRAYLPYQQKDDCRFLLDERNVSRLLDSQFCAGWASWSPVSSKTQQEHLTCGVDRGTPAIKGLLTEGSLQYYLFGVVSYAEAEQRGSECTQHTSVVFTKVVKFIPMILRYLIPSNENDVKTMDVKKSNSYKPQFGAKSMSEIRFLIPPLPNDDYPD